MIVDFHSHTFPVKIAASTLEKLSAASHTPPFTDGTNQGLLSSMARAGIDCSVVLPVATNPKQVRKVNDAAAAVNEQCGQGGLLSFGCIHPDCEDWHAELGRLAAMGIRGIKIHPVYQNADIDDIRFLRILNRAGELGLLVLAHSGQDIGFPGVIRCAPLQVRRALEQVGPVSVILAHMGGWRDWPQVRDCLADTTVYLDTSFSLGEIPMGEDAHYSEEERQLLSAEAFVDMVRLFGAQRILFGSDSPWNDQRGEVEKIRALPLSEGEKTAILGGNAAELLGLSVP